MDIDDMIDILSVQLLGVVPEDDHIVISSNRGEPVVLNPDSKAGIAFRNIAGRIMGEEIPLLPLNEEVGLFSRLRRFFGWAQ